MKQAVCVYYYHDDGDVAVTTTEIEEGKTLEDAKEQVIESEWYNSEPDLLEAFVINPQAWQWLKKIEWPKSPYDDLGPEWGQLVDQCEFSAYKACELKLDVERIKKFLDRLEGPEGCNFREEVKGDPDTITWTCDGIPRSRALAKKILTNMNVTQEEQEEVLAICEANGGYCDCEILFNAKEALAAAYKEEEDGG